MADHTPHADREGLTFASSDGSSTIHAWVWWPEGAWQGRPRGVVQVVHGMAEHVLRYDELARDLAAAGFVVAGDDHIGHGASCPRERHGCLPAADGADCLVEDERKLRALVQAQVPTGTPHVLFGHSLGSYITRVYCARHGGGLAGAVICGTGTVAPALSHAGHALARALAATRGEDYRSKLVDGMGVGAYAKDFADEGPYAWISANPANVAAYEADPDCGFMFTVGGYCAVTALTGEACSPACAERVPHDLPLLFVAGAEDPVGDHGAGVREAARLAQDAGSTDVRVHIYEGLRHEILNEGPEAHARVVADVLAWLDDVAPAPADAPADAG